MNATAFAMNMLKNFNPTNSVLAGGAASLLIYLIGLGLVTGGVALPFIGIPTMAMVGAAAIGAGHLITTFVPDSMNQQLNGLASKLNMSAQEVKALIPTFEDSFPGDNTTPPAANNFGG